MGIDPRSQVRNLIEGIKITHFDAFKAQIMTTASLGTDYNGFLFLYKTFIDKIKKVSPLELNISGVESSNHKVGGQKKRKGGIGGSVEEVYYSKEEYKALSSDPRASLYKKRQARGHKPTENKVMSKGGDASDDMVNQVSALVSVMKSAPEAPGTANPPINSKNHALTKSDHS